MSLVYRRVIFALPVTAAIALLGLGVTTASLHGRAEPTRKTTALSTPRSGHAAVLLGDGRVLLSGGREDFSTGSEVLDPATGKAAGTAWEDGRVEHTATLLPGGMLLMIGGQSGRGATATAELVDPTRGVVARLQLTRPRSGHTATLLLDGSMVVLGGRDEAGRAQSDGEVFEVPGSDGGPYAPELGAFHHAAAALRVPRADHTATLLPDGTILVAGGRNASGELASVEIYDPKTRASRPIEANLKQARADHTATLRSDGNILVLGGRSGDHVLDTTEIYLAKQGRFRDAGLTGARASHTASLLPSGDVLVTGGDYGTGPVREAEVLPAPRGDREVPAAAAVLPPSESQDVALLPLISVRFGRPLDVRSLVAGHFVLTGPAGDVPAILTPGESGLYAFLLPQVTLEPGTWYRVRGRGLVDTTGNRVDVAWRFRTQGTVDSPEATSNDEDTKSPTALTVSAGPDALRLLPALVDLQGQVTGGAGTVTIAWSKVSGPGTVVFGSPSTAATTALVTVPGVYVLRLQATDDNGTLSDEMTLTVRVRGDYNSDSKPDLLWQETGASVLYFWYMNGVTRIGVSPDTWTIEHPNKKIAAFGDFNSDGKTDLVIQHYRTAQIWVELRDGITPIADRVPTNPPTSPDNDPNWMVVGAPDLNRDGKADLLFQHQLEGTLQAWYMDGVNRTDTVLLNPDWRLETIKVVSTDDFNGDGKPDILWQHAGTGVLQVWYMDGVRMTDFQSTMNASPGADWRVVFTGHFNGDTTPDLILQNKTTGYLKAWFMGFSVVNGAPTLRKDLEVPLSPEHFETDPTLWWVAGNFAWNRGPLVDPVITPVSGTYLKPIEVKITAHPGSVHYTLDGSDPTETSPLYTGPLYVDKSLTVKAVSILSGFVPSGISTATYTIGVATPAISLPSGTYPSGQTTTITCSTPGAVIHYTTNGAEPTESDPTIPSGTPLVIDRSFTLKAKAWKGTVVSATATATYTVPTRSILYVVGGPSPQAGELGVRDHLQARGYAVEIKDDGATVREDADGRSAVLFSSNVGSGANLAAFWDVTVGLVVFESNLWDDFKIATWTQTSVQTQVTVAAPDHPLAAHREGTVSVYQGPTSVIEAPIVAPGAIVVALQPTSLAPVYLAVETGGQLLQSQTAKGRRVAMFDPKAPMTAHGWAMLDAAVDWAGETHRAKALFLGAQRNPPTLEDQIAINRIASLGYSVTVRDYSMTDEQILDAVNAMSFVAISSSLVGADEKTGRLFKDRAVPVVIWKADHFDDLLLSQGRGVTSTTKREVTIADPAHPLAAGLTGTVEVVDPGHPRFFGWCIPRPGGVTIATIPGEVTSHAGVFGFELGADLAPGSAPERRVGLFMNDPTTFSFLTTSGWKLFDAAIEWASGGDSDNDGLTNKEESLWGTDPHKADTNDDGILDGAEVAAGLSPTNRDMDGDGVDNLDERNQGTNPFDADSDDDGCLDGNDDYPLNPAWCTRPTGHAGPPVITLIEPTATPLP